MSNKIYPNTAPFAHERNTNVNFNYVWDSDVQNWTPEVEQITEVGITGGYVGVTGQVDVELSHNDEISKNAKSFIHKFGSNPDVDQSVSITSPETIWDGSSDFLFPPNAGTSIQMTSTSSSDSQSIVIEGLDDDFQNQTWEGSLNGVSYVQVPSLKWSRVFRAYNNGSSSLIGDVNISQVGNPSNIYAKILDGNNQTLMAVYTIPSDCIGYLVRYQATAHNSQSASGLGYTMHMRVRKFGKVFRTQSVTSVSTTHEVVQEFPFALALEPKTDILFNLVSANGNNGGVNVDFDIALLPV